MSRFFLFILASLSVFSLTLAQKVLFTNNCLGIVDQQARLECGAAMNVLLQQLKQTLRSDQIIIPDLCENSNCYEDPVTGRQCHQNGTTVTCSCPGTGYRDAGPPNKIPGIFCEDVDECSEGSDRCGAHGAKCTNEVGSYECKCRFPYTGDGRNCDTNDECQIAHLCHKNANCQPLKKYQGCYRSETDSWSLIEQDDMDADTCIKHCRKNHNTTTYAALHGNSCYCKDELTEVDRLETCALPCTGNNKQTCGGGSDDETSFYVTGQLHSCTCKPGYHGDGVTSCDDVDECEDGEKCGSDATCANTVGGYNCACNDRFIMTSQNGCQPPKAFPCVDRTSERKEMWYNCSTVLLLPCEFNGADLMSNGELYHVERSGPYGKCENSKVTTKINRKSIRILDGQDELKKTLRLNTQCMKDESAVITIDRFAANAVNLTLEDIFLGPLDSYTKAKPFQANPKCRGEVMYADGSFYRFKASKECGATSRYMVGAGSNVVEGALHARVGFEGKVISRLTNLYIEYRCSYSTSDTDKQDDVTKTTTTSSASRRIKVAPVEKNQRKHSKVADKNTAASAKSSTLSVWTAPNYINLGGIVESRLTMSVTTRHKEGLAAVAPWERPDVYISLQQIHKNKKLLVQPVRCWAEDVTSGSWKTILKNGCTDVTAGADVTFKYQPFAFVGGGVEKQQIRCLLKFCWEAETCKQTCRAVLDEGKAELGLDWTTAVVSGPVVRVQDRCGPKYKGGCEHYCSVNQFTKEPVCSCFKHFKLYDDKTCRVDVMAVGLGSVPIVEIAVAGGSLFLVVVAAVWGRKRYTEKQRHRQIYSFARGLGDDIGEVADSSILP